MSIGSPDSKRPAAVSPVQLQGFGAPGTFSPAAQGVAPSVAASVVNSTGSSSTSGSTTAPTNATASASPLSKEIRTRKSVLFKNGLTQQATQSQQQQGQQQTQLQAQQQLQLGQLGQLGQQLGQQLSSDDAPVSLSALARGIQIKLFPSNNVVPKINVLVVEDNVINQIILSSFLKKNDIPFTLISNGRDALKEWRKGGYHLILMDIQLPFISGIYCAKEIRRLESVNGIGVSNHKDIQMLISSKSKIPANETTSSVTTTATSTARNSVSHTPNDENGGKTWSAASSPGHQLQKKDGFFDNAQATTTTTTDTNNNTSIGTNDKKNSSTIDNSNSNTNQNNTQNTKGSLHTIDDGHSDSERSTSTSTATSTLLQKSVLMDSAVALTENAIANELEREDSPNPLTDETASDKLDVSKFKQPVIIVALTANSFTEDRDNALAAGCNDFLVKPVNLLWLGKKFAEWGCMQALINFDDWKGMSNREANPSGAVDGKSIRHSKNVEMGVRRLLRRAQAQLVGQNF